VAGFNPADESDPSGMSHRPFQRASLLVALAGLACPALADSMSGPSAPTHVAVTSWTQGRVLLHWTDTSDQETGYLVTRDPPFPEGAVACPANTTMFVDRPGRGQFSYSVVAYNEDGESAAVQSNNVQLSRGEPGDHGPLDPNGGSGGLSTSNSGAPAAPSNLRAVAGTGSIRLDWRDRSNNEDRFEINRQTQSGGAWGADATFMAEANAVTFTDSTTDGTFQYRMRAVNAAGNSAWTGWVIAQLSSGGSQTPSAPPVTPPVAPSGLAVSDMGGGRAMVTWIDNSSDESGFVLERTPQFAGGDTSIGANTSSFIDQSGNGTFSYRVKAVNSAGSSAYTGWVQTTVTSGSGGTPPVLGANSGGPESSGSTSGGGTTSGGTGTGGGTCGGTVGSIGPDGWTVLTPSADSRIIYVSSSVGNDANSGLTEAAPKRSIGAACSQLRDGYPDWVVFKRGDTWHEAFPGMTRSGRSATEPMVIGSYGTGDRPLVTASNVISWIAQDNQPVQHWAIVDLHLDGAGGEGSGIFLGNSFRDVLIENCYFERFGVNLYFGPVSTGQPAQSLRVRRCVLADAYVASSTAPGSHGFLCGAVHGLLVDECVFDHNGWSETVPNAVPTIFRHNTYIYNDCTDVVFRGTITARAGSTGLGQRAGGQCLENLCLQNPVNLGLGHGSVGAATVTGTVRNNVILDSRDIDAANGRGMGLGVTWGGGVEVDHNIIAHQRTGTSNAWGMNIDYSFQNVSIHDNVIYDWRIAGGAGTCDDPTFMISGTAIGPTQVYNNDFQATRGGFAAAVTHSIANITFGPNRYWSVNPSNMAFLTPPGPGSAADWSAYVGVPGNGNLTQAAYPDPGRDITTYMTAIGGSPTLAAFMAEARHQERGNWRPAYTAKAVNDYIRAGFGMPSGIP
jgi:hypothetical protein